MHYMMYTIFKVTLLLGVLNLVTACATVQTTNTSADIEITDPYESTNRSVYAFNEGLDRHILKPVAIAYAGITPDPVQAGVTNFFSNLGYLNVIVNTSLQGKLDQGLSDLFRFVFNSTIGVAGVFDIASGMGLVENKEDLGQTLAVWGSGQGAYLTLPFFGPNTARDAPDLISSTLLNPVTYMTAAVMWPATALKIVNLRANLLETSDILETAATDPYSFTREAYLQQRRNLIYDGSPPESDSYNDIFEEEIDSGAF